MESRFDDLPAPLVSVVILAFNIADYIRDAVESARAQTVQNIEILVIDDGSVDGTADQLVDIKDSRLRILRQDNSGIAAARNAGVEAARGAFVGFLDGDDLWPPTKLERHLETFAQHPGVDVTYSLVKVTNAHGKQIGFVLPQSGGEVSFCDLFRENLIRSGSAAVLRTEALRRAGPFDRDLRASTDLDMWLRIASKGRGRIYCIPECLTTYRRRPGQVTADWRRMEAAWQQVLGKARGLAPEDVGRLEPRANSEKYLYFAALVYESGDHDRALQLLEKSYRFCPKGFVLRVRPWLLAAACYSGRLFPRSVHRFLVACGVACVRFVSQIILLRPALFGR